MGEVVFFALETGGLRFEHPIIQIGAAATDQQFQVLDSFEVKIHFNPEACEPDALRLNCFDIEVWKDEAVTEKEAAEVFSRFLRSHATLQKTSKKGKGYKVARLGGHNVVNFHIPRLRAMFRRHDAFLPADAFCPLDTLQKASWFQFEHPNKCPFNDLRLDTLVNAFGIEVKGLEGQAPDAVLRAAQTAGLARILSGRE